RRDRRGSARSQHPFPMRRRSRRPRRRGSRGRLPSHLAEDGAHYLMTITTRSAKSKTTRRPRGEPRRLLLDAARELFARQDYRATTTREIAEAAGVAEHLLFRNFGSKAALFREALVIPFATFVDEFSETWSLLDPDASDEEEVATQFVGQLYDVFVE